MAFSSLAYLMGCVVISYDSYYVGMKTGDILSKKAFWFMRYPASRFIKVEFDRCLELL